MTREPQRDCDDYFIFADRDTTAAISLSPASTITPNVTEITATTMNFTTSTATRETSATDVNVTTAITNVTFVTATTIIPTTENATVGSTAHEIISTAETSFATGTEDTGTTTSSRKSTTLKPTPGFTPFPVSGTYLRFCLRD